MKTKKKHLTVKIEGPVGSGRSRLKFILISLIKLYLVGYKAKDLGEEYEFEVVWDGKQ